MDGAKGIKRVRNKNKKGDKEGIDKGRKKEECERKG